MNILEELWNGELCPVAREQFRTEAYRELVRLYQRNEEKLLPTLNDAQKEDLQKMVDLAEKMRGIAECNAFITGFRLAVRLMVASVGPHL